MTQENGGGSQSSDKRLAPVIPLFGGKSRASDARDNASAAPLGDHEGDPSERHPAHGRAGVERVPPRLRALVDPATAGDAIVHLDTGAGAFPMGTESSEPPVDPEELRSSAAESLVKKLRARSLSISESRLLLRGHGLAAAQVDDVIDDFCRRGYLDDATLAEQLVESGSQRKGQGRVALSRALAQRGLSRDVIDAALEELPDDDAERALEFARSKARSLSRLDPETGLRRLVGQLARRGYGGSVAMTAAKTALREASFGGPTTGVRFVDSD